MTKFRGILGGIGLVGAELVVIVVVRHIFGGVIFSLDIVFAVGAVHQVAQALREPNRPGRRRQRAGVFLVGLNGAAGRQKAQQEVAPAHIDALGRDVRSRSSQAFFLMSIFPLLARVSSIHNTQPPTYLDARTCCLRTPEAQGIDAKCLNEHASIAGPMPEEGRCGGAPGVRRELRALGGEIEDVDGHLAFGLDQGDLDVAFLMRKLRTDAMQQTETGPE